MATVSLQTAFDEARRAIETGAADKAIGIAQHILTHFPRMIEGSRLLGEAYLNAGQPEEAEAAFKKVLDADPENVAAYYGRGLAQQSLDQRAAAITSFERALEIQPNLADLRTQLMRLYAETPGSAGQFRLSRAGLGRLYARGGMFSQAVDEFRAVLDAEPDRDDVQVALAEALWRDGQEDEALEYCRDVLEQQPDLIKPTVLQGYMLVANGHPEGDTLWRRAAEQDATMALARTLFDILPPIRIEEPVLPEFDEAEWRAQAARRATQAQAATEALPVPAAQESDDDMFADSWLSTAGTAAATAGVSQTYDAPPVAAQAVGSADDDDLLASLLGFSDDAPVSQAVDTADADTANVQPFSFDDWDTPAPAQGAAALPESLDALGVADEPQAESGSTDFGNLQPFALDDWDLDAPDSAPAATATPTPDIHEQDTQPIAFEAAERPDSGVSADVQPFSLDLDDEPGDNIRPFSFEAESGAAGGVQPFALDDDLDVAPFSFEDDAPDAPTAAADQSPDSGLGAVQPFSLDDWGLDDSAPSAAQQPFSGTGRADDGDDIGDLKPFSLDELSLDAIDSGAAGQLSGPSQAEPEAPPAEAKGFNWQEPAWRSQMAQSPRPSETQSDESIFSKLVRDRQPDAAPLTPETLPPEERFFSMDDEPLRLDLDDIDQSAASAEFADPVSPEPASAEAPSGADSLAAPAAPDAPAAETPAQQAELAEPDAALPFSLDELAASDEAFSWETAAAEQPADQAGSAEDLVPFSLADLGLSDEELAALDEQPEATADTDEGPSTTPFSLADLGLSDDEIAALDLGDMADSGDVEAADAGAAQSQTAPDATEDEAAAPTAFSLADLGLDDDELGLLNQSDTSAPQAGLSDADTTDAELADIFASFDDAPEADASAPVGGESAPTMPALDEDALSIAPFSFDAVDTGAETPASGFDFGSSDAEQPAEEWHDLQSQLDVDVPATRTPDDFLAEAQETDGDVQSVLDTMPGEGADDDTAGALPFSLADLGLDDDEIASFDQADTGVAQSETGGQSADASADDLFGMPSDSEAFAPFGSETTAVDTGAADAELAEEQAADTATGAAEPSSMAEADDAYVPFGAGDDEAETTVEAESAYAFDEPAHGSADAELGAGAPDGGMADAALTSDEQAQPASTDTADNVEQVEAQPELAAAPAAAAASVAQPAAAPAAAPASGDRLGLFRSQLAANPGNDALRLAIARMSQNINDVGGAMEQYKALIKRGSFLDDVVEDIQDSIADNDEPSVLRRLHRLLGDAYMKQNRLDEAMEQFSWTSGQGT